MTDRDRLIEILKVPIYPKIDVDPAEVVADYLLANDFTKVVRCKDCKNYTKWEQASAKWEGKALHCIKFRRKVNPNDFCSYGELKELGK